MVIVVRTGLFGDYGKCLVDERQMERTTRYWRQDGVSDVGDSQRKKFLRETKKGCSRIRT